MKLLNSNIDKFWYFLIYTLALFPILPRGIESVIMILLFISSLLLYLLTDKNKIPKNTRIKVVILSTVFILYVIGLPYSENLKEGFKYIIRALPFLVFPLIFGIFRKGKLKKTHLERVFYLYVFSLLLGLVFSHIYLAVNNNTNSSWEYRNAFEALIGVHGTYYSLWIAFGVFILFSKIKKAIITKDIKLTIAIIFVIGYFIYWQIVIGARLPLITTILLVTITFLLKIIKKRAVLIGAFLIGSIILGVVITKKVATYNFTLPEGNYDIEHKDMTSEQIRTGIYYCAVDLIKNSWIIGYGIGDVDNKLQNCYKEKIKSDVYQTFNYNSHNQYLHFLLSNGLIGLLLFLISLALPIYISYQTSNSLYMLLSLLLIISLFTENVLSRHDGILFFSFFSSIFAFRNNNVF